MKKSKIIIPALGVLVLSTAASITGTVAWFTATRTATVSVGDMAVVNVDGNLVATLLDGYGTDVDGTTVSAETNTELSDASFNPVEKQLYNDTGDGTAFVKVGNNTEYTKADSQVTSHSGDWYIRSYKVSATDHYVYHAFSWTVKLTYTWGAEKTDLNIFFDYSSATASKMTPSLAAGGAATNQTSKGFRIALIPELASDANTVVFAGNRTLTDVSTAANRLSAVDEGDTDVFSVVNYGVSPLNSGFSYFLKDGYGKASVAQNSATSGYLAKAADNSANQRARADYIGKIVSSNSDKTDDLGVSNYLLIRCVAWYEGTDPLVINSSDLEKVRTDLKFYSAVNGSNS